MPLLLVRVPCLAVALMVVAHSLQATPPHPTVLLADYDKSLHPVIDVAGTDPIINTEAGRTTRIRKEVGFAADRAPYYADGFIRFGSIMLDGLRFVEIYNEGDDPASTGNTLTTVAYFDATIVSDQPLAHCFIAILCFDRDFLGGHTDRPQTQIVLHDVPDLTPGEEVKLHFSTTAFRDRVGAVFFPLIFTAGREVRTNITDTADRYFARVEQVQHTAQLAAYREKFAGQNHTAVPVVTIRPALPPDTAMPKDEQHIARLFVGEDGLVNDADITPEFSSRIVQTEVLRALRGWRFLPKLVNGEPTVAQIKFPLK